MVKGKKGDVPDIMFWVIVSFILVTGMFIISFVTVTVADGLNIAGLNNTAEGANAIQELENFGTNTIQRGTLFLIFGLLLGTFISAFLVRTHPIFMFLYIIFGAISVLLSVYLANAYDLVRNTSAFTSTLASQSWLNVIMENIVLLVIVGLVISMIIVFAKFSSGGRATQGRL